jgi:acetyltransferase
MGKLVRETNKPIVLHSMYKFARPHAHDLLRYYGIPVFDSVDVTCKCISVLAEYGRYLKTRRTRTNFVLRWRKKATPQGEEIVGSALAEDRHLLLEHEAKRLLGVHGAPVTGDRLVASADEAARVAEEVGFPVALKICSPQILHKSDAHGVRLGLQDAAETREAFAEIVEGAKRHDASAEIRGCVVGPMASAGTEVIIGTRIDPQFGPVIMFGIGGIFVEVLRDVVFRVLPINRRAAREMLAEIRSAPLLNGVRGQPPVDREALVDLLLTISEVAEAYPEIREMDLNPVIVREKGLSVVDARMILGNAR